MGQEIFQNFKVLKREPGESKYLFQVVRRLIYTINSIEGFNRKIRKVTKAKLVFSADDSLFKMLYLAMMDMTAKWTGRRLDWGVIYT